MAESFEHKSINISVGIVIKTLLLIVLLLALYKMSDVVLVVVASIVIASAIEPVVRKLKRRGIHRVISVILMYLIVAAIMALILIFFMPLLVNDIGGLIRSLPATFSLDDLWSPAVSNGLSFSSVTDTLSAHTISLSDFFNGIQSVIVGTSAGAFKTASVIFGGFLSLILMIVLSFYLAVQEDGVDDFLRIITPVKHHEYIIDLWKRSQRKIALWLQGQVILGIVVGVLVYLVLMIVGIPYALVLAVLAGLFEIIPVFGPIISSVPAILIAFADRGLGTGVLLVCLYVVIYQFCSIC